MDAHVSSGIPNRAFYTAAIALGGHSWETAGRIWYAALTAYPPSPAMKMSFADEPQMLKAVALLNPTFTDDHLLPS